MIFLTQIANQKTPSPDAAWCEIEVMGNDVIAMVQVEGALRRHNIHCAYSSRMWDIDGITAACTLEQAAKILNREAPQSRFGVQIYRLRRGYEIPLRWSKGKTIAQLDKMYPALKVASRISEVSFPVTDSTVLEYRVRVYTGFDNKRHTGLEIKPVIANRVTFHQFLDPSFRPDSVLEW